MAKATLRNVDNGHEIEIDAKKIDGWEIGDIISNDISGQEDGDTEEYELICRGTYNCECGDCSDEEAREYDKSDLPEKIQEEIEKYDLNRNDIIFLNKATQEICRVEDSLRELFYRQNNMEDWLEII
jgi:hypothetical protein